ncbi:hypothetical protein BDW22DRAFT_1332193 [Trametopsis cervina]|nr:hypothetical protein BDW22DRAFT_1332193 [Trametopsis cervina]
MPRFIAGDELGSIKSVSYTPKENSKDWEATVNTLAEGSSSGGRAKAIQKLVLTASPDDPAERLLATARADGSASVFLLNLQNNTLEEQASWQETRLKQSQKYVGLSFGERGVYTCTSNGALRRTIPSGESDTGPEPQLAVLPTRLTEWRLASNEQTFAYAGDEVELSIWDTERAFTSKPEEVSSAQAKEQDAASKKRKRTEQLFPGEIWRAKNLPNDSLNLRQPVRNTAFAYLQPSTSPSQQHILVGTQFGDVRRYDTRAARRPVSNWKGIGKVGGIGAIENGLTEHQVFVSDRGSNLYALDLRNGNVTFGYKGFSGAVTSMASCPSFLASAAEDRYVRFHSTFPPPTQIGQQQEHKGAVLEKAYVKVVPTVVVWDRVNDVSTKGRNAEDEEDEDNEDGVWDEMEDAETDEEEPVGRKKKTRAK